MKAIRRYWLRHRRRVIYESTFNSLRESHIRWEERLTHETSGGNPERESIDRNDIQFNLRWVAQYFDVACRWQAISVLEDDRPNEIRAHNHLIVAEDSLRLVLREACHHEIDPSLVLAEYVWGERFLPHV